MRAEAEVVTSECASPSLYVAFDAVGDASVLSGNLSGRRVSFAVWTTTPWTLPSNRALSLHPGFEYVFYQLDERVVCVAKDVLPRFLSEVSETHLGVKQVTVPGSGQTLSAAVMLEPSRVLAYAEGEALTGLRYLDPLSGREGPLLLREQGMLELGTGFFPVAPGHSFEDFALGLAHGLEIYSPITDAGCYDESIGQGLAGRPVLEVEPFLLEMLSQRGALLNPKGETVTMRHPFCGRCQGPLILRASGYLMDTSGPVLPPATSGGIPIPGIRD